MGPLIVLLKQWIANLVALIFLATLLEMLLPRGNMQRFARVVMGMLVILAVLQPVFSLLGRGFNLDGLQAAVSGPNLSVDAILAQADKLRQANDALTLAKTGEQLAMQIAARVQQLPGVARATCEVRLVGDKARADYGSIAAVTVLVTPGTPPAVGGITPVAPVTIGGGNGGGGSGSGGVAAVLTTELRSDILRVLATDYGLTAERVTLAAAGS